MIRHYKIFLNFVMFAEENIMKEDKDLRDISAKDMEQNNCCCLFCVPKVEALQLPRKG